MPNFSQKIHPETVSATFIIILFSLFILVKFAFGFILPLYLLSLSLSFLMAVFYPRSGFFAILFLTFVFARFFTLEPIYLGRTALKLYPLDIIFLGTIIGIIFQLINKKIRFTVLKSDKLVGIFILLSFFYFLASLHNSSTDFSTAFSTFKNYAFYSIFYFVSLLLFSKKEYWERLIKFSLVGASTLIFFIVYGVINGEGLWTEFTPLSTSGTRVISFDHAFYISLIFLPAIIYLVYHPKNQKKFLYLLLSFWLVGIIGSLMRHIWVGILGSFGVLFLIFDSKQKSTALNLAGKYLVAAGVITITVVYLSLLIPYSKTMDKILVSQDFVSQRIASFSNVSSDESFAWRENVWAEGLKKYKEHPLVGIGYGQNVSIDTGSYRAFVEIRNIHNSPLILFIQMGLWTFGLFLFLVASIFYSLWKKKNPDWIDYSLIWKKKNPDWIDYSLISLLVYYIIAFQFQPYLEANLLGIFFWIILGLMRAKSQLSEKFV